MFSITMNTGPPETAPVENKPFVVFVLVLILLIGVALWQFYSLAWGEVLRTSYSVGTPDRPAAAALAAMPD